MLGRLICQIVSVAGCLGYDVLVPSHISKPRLKGVSVAGCLGYDVLDNRIMKEFTTKGFSCWLFRL
ncbi:hypothetical protein BCLUESOX_2358 [bacterium endosymbiont of Bathymodiolus sp. 5 South]|nr:hypothetical protein BCLUESOX_2358 [bacterium endosymbiont of Bathymodiolus sp. 5 South]VVH56193.1 hypothetical protein BSPCLSOX_2456 [uncultured Gammaproteobacteria bacterium]